MGLRKQQIKTKTATNKQTNKQTNQISAAAASGNTAQSQLNPEGHHHLGCGPKWKIKIKIKY
jgi:hypothetical protein